MGILSVVIKLMFILSIRRGAFSVCNAQNALTINAVVGQDVTIPCGVQVNGQWERLVWKLLQVNSSERLAVSYDGYRDCDTSKKEDCLLTQDGTLVLRDVTERDSEDYFCVLETEEKYYSHHRLIVHPEGLPPAIRECPAAEDVSVYQTGPQEMVLAYTSPVCSNKHEIGNVTCDPPSGAKIGISVTEIACQCTHSGILVDTCEIPIPDLPLGFVNCPASDSVLTTPQGESSQVVSYETPVCQNAKNVIGLVSCEPPSGSLTDDEEIVCTCHHGGNIVDRCEIPIPAAVGCSQATGPGCFVGIVIVVFITLFTIIALVVMCKYLKRKSSHIEARRNVEMNEQRRKSKGYAEMNQPDQVGEKLRQGPILVLGTPLNSSQQSHELVNNKDSTPDAGKTQGGKPVASVTDTDNYAGDCPDGGNQTARDFKQFFGNMKQFLVQGKTPLFRILPSMVKPSSGFEIECQFLENLQVHLHSKDGETTPDFDYKKQILGLSVSVAELVALPVYITCGKCAETCCTLEIYGDEWLRAEEKARSMETDGDDEC